MSPLFRSEITDGDQVTSATVTVSNGVSGDEVLASISIQANKSNAHELAKVLNINNTEGNVGTIRT